VVDEKVDRIILRMVSDADFRERLMSTETFKKAVDEYDLTQEEMDRIWRTVCKKRGISGPFSQGLSERLSK
jgi:uncharacterized protein (DUF2384 family)